MKISAVTILNPFKPQYSREKNTPLSSSQPVFTSNDRFEANSIVKTELDSIATDIKEEIIPYREKYKNTFIQLGKIGYDSQEKLKLVKNYETMLMNKKFNAANNEIFKQASKNALLYEKYKNNIDEFERTAQFAQKNNYYSNTEIVKLINTSRPKMIRDAEEFSKLEPTYNKVNETTELMNADLEKICSGNLPNFHNKIMALNEQNKTAAMLMFISDYPDTTNICNEYKNILNEYQTKKLPMYDLLKKIEKLSYKIQKFKENQENSEERLAEINRFVEENKNYKTENISEKTIKTTYDKLLKNTDDTIIKYSKDLQDYVNKHPVNISPRITDRTFKMQARIIKQLNELIWQEKQKFYSQTNQDFIDKQF